MWPLNGPANIWCLHSFTVVPWSVPSSLYLCIFLQNVIYYAYMLCPNSGKFSLKCNFPANLDLCPWPRRAFLFCPWYTMSTFMRKERENVNKLTSTSFEAEAPVSTHICRFFSIYLQCGMNRFSLGLKLLGKRLLHLYEKFHSFLYRSKCNKPGCVITQ